MWRVMECRAVRPSNPTSVRAGVIWKCAACRCLRAHPSLHPRHMHSAMLGADPGFLPIHTDLHLYMGDRDLAA